MSDAGITFSLRYVHLHVITYLQLIDFNCTSARSVTARHTSRCPLFLDKTKPKKTESPVRDDRSLLGRIFGGKSERWPSLSPFIRVARQLHVAARDCSGQLDESNVARAASWRRSSRLFSPRAKPRARARSPSSPGLFTLPINIR